MKTNLCSILFFTLFLILTLYLPPCLAQDYITGPWLWMIAPTTDGIDGSRTVHDDSLAAASDGAVTEECVAANGAKVGDSVGDYAWTLSTIRNTGIINTGCCQGSEIDNVTDVVQRVGWTEGNVDYHSSYALITLESAASQSNVLMRIGSDDAVKVWLNGTVVHTNPADRSSRGFQDEFRVNLIRGDNLLLVKVSEGWGNWSMFVGINANVNAVYKPSTQSCSPQSAVTPVVTTSDTTEFRVKGGAFADFTDSKGRVWRGAQQSNQTWGGWIDKQPRIATDTTLTTNAEAEAEDAGYDAELFHAVSWALHPDTVKYQFKTGNGTFDVTYLVGEHWSPNNRGFDIIIEGEIVEPLYVTPGRHEIDIKTYKAIEVNDGTLDLHFSGNLGTQVADLNPMFSALEVVPSLTDPTTTTQITEPLSLSGDVNRDGVVNIMDLVLVASNFQQRGEHPADVNNDGIVNIVDLVLVAGGFGDAAAPSARYRNLDAMFTSAEVEHWLTQAQELNLTDATSLYGIRYLEHLLMVLPPKETALLANYPNPFNPETWIPYQLAKPAEVTLHIYGVDGTLVRTLSLGHKPVGIYQSRSRAAYWDGRNAVGEPIASGVYFYTLTAGDFTATRKMLIRK